MSANQPATLGGVLTENSLRIPVCAAERYPMAGIYSYARGLFSKAPIMGSETAYKIFHRVSDRQIVLSTLKGWEGALALADQSCEGRYLPPHNVLFDIDITRAEPDYLGWVIKWPKLWEQLKGASRGMGARRETVSADDFLRCKLPLPSLSEQRRIVTGLNVAAGMIATHSRMATDVGAEIAATLRSAFAKVTSDAPRVPMAEVAPLVRRPVQIDLDGIYPELGVRSFGKGTFHKPSLTGVELGAKRLFQIKSRDLLFNIVFAWEGAVAVAGSDDDARVGSHRFLTCVPDPDRATADFLCYWFLSGEGLQKLGQASPGGAGRNRTLGTKALEAIAVPLPPLGAQLWFDDLQRRASAASNAQRNAQRDLNSLLPAMLKEAFE